MRRAPVRPTTAEEGSRKPLARWHLLPAGASPDAAVLLSTRGMRAFGDGFVGVLLPLHLSTLGFDALRIGAVTTVTLVGSAALTLGVGLVAYRFPRRHLLFSAAVLTIATGIGFFLARDLWPLLLVAFVGTLNPLSGDVSVFLPLEQALVPQTVPDSQRTALFARYSLVRSLVGACGALCAGVPAFIAARTGIGLAAALDGMFLVYALLGLLALLRYRHLSPAIEPGAGTPDAPLRESRRTVFTLAALFSLDALGAGFVVQSLLALWLFQRYGLSVAAGRARSSSGRACCPPSRTSWRCRSRSGSASSTRWSSRTYPRTSSSCSCRSCRTCRSHSRVSSPAPPSRRWTCPHATRT